MLVDDKIYPKSRTQPGYLALKHAIPVANRLGGALVLGILGSVKHGR